MGKWMVGPGPWLRGEIFDERSSKRVMGFYEGKRLGQKLILAMNISGKEVVCRGKSTYHSLLDNATAVMVGVLNSPLLGHWNYRDRPILGWLKLEIPWRRAWQPTPVFLPRESHG